MRGIHELTYPKLLIIVLAIAGIALVIFKYYTLTLILLFLCAFILSYEVYKERKNKYLMIVYILSLILVGSVILMIFEATFNWGIRWPLEFFSLAIVIALVLAANIYAEKWRKEKIKKERCEK